MVRMVHTLDRMDQLDRRIADNVLREMSIAAMELNQLAEIIGMSERTLWRRFTEGGFKMRELGLIADALNCQLHTLVPKGKAA